MNFYSFRKINRERNVWIYKHKLFHRDHPEDLHQVRRRTCPGVDGRKQRFSRFSARKLSKFDDDKDDNNSSDDDSSVDGSGDEHEAGAKKRRGSASSMTSLSKRARRLWQGDDMERIVKVDTSILPDPIASPTKLFNPSTLSSKELLAEDDSSTNKKNDRMEMLERSMIVSEVASKLEEFAKKAMKGRGSARSKRAGVVTPPYGSSTSGTISSRGLITYDDEYLSKRNVSGVVSDEDETVESVAVCSSVPARDSGDFNVAPVECGDMVQQIVDQIKTRAAANFYDADSIKGCAKIAELMMTNAPAEETSVSCTKVVELLGSSERLAADFHSYRNALQPESMFSHSADSGEFDHLVSLRRALQSVSSRHDALQQFKIFAVNLIYKLLGKNGSFGVQPFSQADFSKLLHTADAWSKSVGIVV